MVSIKEKFPGIKPRKYGNCGRSFYEGIDKGMVLYLNFNGAEKLNLAWSLEQEEGFQKNDELLRGEEVKWEDQPDNGLIALRVIFLNGQCHNERTVQLVDINNDWFK